MEYNIEQDSMKNNRHNESVGYKTRGEESFGTKSTIKTKIYLIGKSIFDLVASLCALILLMPILLIVALVIYIDDPKGSPIFVQERCGLDGKKFKFYKFRTMIVNAEQQLEELRYLNEVDGPVFKIKDDPRITRVGKFLRKTCIDELPQLYNVLIGDMSFVGPRPPIPKEVEQYSEHQMQRLTVTPGLTCYWQTKKKRNLLLFDDWIELDLKYIAERSWILDLKLIFKTILVMFHGEGE